mgnify:CR=1 FL=1
MQEKIRTIHVYFEEFGEEDVPEAEGDILEAELVPEPEPERTRYKIPGVLCILYLVVICIGIPAWTLLIPPSYATIYDTTIAKTLTLILSQHPTTKQVQLSTLPTIKKTEQVTVSATGTLHQSATKAQGLITFYNGLFTSQTVPANTKLTGKDGITVVTSQTAVIPAAIQTTPPTYGTVSVTAYSAIAGTVGDIAASDIDQACCGSSILAQNLYAFSGGQDERDIPVLTKPDLSTGTQTLTSQVTTAVSDQAQGEVKPGYILLPLQCSQSLTSNHQPGDQAATAILMLKETCIPLAYFAVDIATVSQRSFTIPHGFHLVSFTALVLTSNTTPAGGTLTVHAISYLKQDRPSVILHYAGAK